MNRIKILFILYILVVSCSNDKDKVLTVFKDEINVSPSRVVSLEDYDVLKPIDVLKVNEDYLIRDDKAYNLFTKINFQRNTITRGIDKGNGPNEVNFITSVEQYKNKILIFDTSNKKISSIDIDNDSTLTLREETTLNAQNRSSMINYINNGFIGSGMFKDFWIGYFDIHSEALKSSISFPVFEETDHLVDIQKSVIFINTLTTVHPHKNKFVAATMKCGVLSFCEMSNDNIINEYKQIKYYPPQFNVVDDFGNIAYDKQYKVAFCDIDCCDDYVYVLYSGRSFETHGLLNHHCEHLLVYDWSGSPIKHYKLEIPMSSMRYDNQNKSIYGIGYNTEGVLLEYKL